MAPIVLKFKHNKEVRRLTVEQPLTFVAVTHIVRQLFPDVLNFALKYQDPENDKITVTTQTEIQEAVNVGVNQNNVLVFFVEEKVEDKPSEAVNPAPVSIPSPVLSLSSPSTAQNVHFGVTCDGCQVTPITGIRYKCTVCHDFDLCSKCEATKTHDQAHPLIQITQPNTLRGRFGGCGGGWRRFGGLHHGGFHGFHGAHAPNDPNSNNDSNNSAIPNHPWGFWGWCHGMKENKYKAVFTQNITVDWGVTMRPNEPFVKVWRMKNEGETAWPEETGLSFVDGELMGAPILVPLSRTVNPGEEIEISVNMITPKESGKHVSQWRLMYSEGKFGQKLWVAIVVDDSKNNEKNEVNQESNENKETASTKRVSFSEPVSEVIPDPKPVEQQPVISSSPVQSVPTPVSNPSSPVQSVPVPEPEPSIFDVESATEEEEQSISTLKELGFRGDLLGVLRSKNGDLMAAIQELLDSA